MSREDPPPGKCQFSLKDSCMGHGRPYEKQLPTHTRLGFSLSTFSSTSSFLNIAVEIAYSILTSDVQLTILAGFFLMKRTSRFLLLATLKITLYSIGRITMLYTILYLYNWKFILWDFLQPFATPFAPYLC